MSHSLNLGKVVQTLSSLRLILCHYTGTAAMSHSPNFGKAPQTPSPLRLILSHYAGTAAMSHSLNVGKVPQTLSPLRLILSHYAGKAAMSHSLKFGKVRDACCLLLAARNSFGRGEVERQYNEFTEIVWSAEGHPPHKHYQSCKKRVGSRGVEEAEWKRRWRACSRPARHYRSHRCGGAELNSTHRPNCNCTTAAIMQHSQRRPMPG
jgi:hypothetical protein